MRSPIRSLLLLAAATLPLSGLADNHATPKTYVYITYLDCTGSTSTVDHLVESTFAPMYDAAIEAGGISSWGWLTHHTGGTWDRAVYFAGENLDKLLASLDGLNNEITANQGGLARAVAQACPQHVDYIWVSAAGPDARPAPEARGDAGVSIYLTCDQSRERRLDQLFTENLAPLLDAEVKSGRLVSWGWFRHYIGGTHTRLLTYTGETPASTIAAVDRTLGTFSMTRGRQMNEMHDICQLHEDYVWLIRSSVQ